MYKRQELESAGNMADNLQMLGASMDKANSIDDTPVMDIDGAELRPDCLLYTSRCV